jgi:hypothetical protein
MIASIMGLQVSQAYMVKLCSLFWTCPLLGVENVESVKVKFCFYRI